MLLSFLMAMGAAVRARITRDIPYDSTSDARLDVYAPIGADGEAPVIVVGHDATMSGAERNRLGHVGAALASRGFVTVIVRARPSADGAVEAALTNLAAAIAWSKTNAGSFGGDAARIFLMGQAGGAAAVAKLCLEDRWPEPYGARIDDLRGGIGISGAYEPIVAPLSGPRPPMLLIAGQSDAVDPESTSLLARAMRTAGGQVTEIRYPKLSGKSHLQRLTAAFRFRALVLGEVERFVRYQSLGAGT